MALNEFKLQVALLKRAAKVVNAFESEQVQLRVIDSMLAALVGPDRPLADLEGGSDEVTEAAGFPGRPMAELA
jgi:hypothetical protein